MVIVDELRRMANALMHADSASALPQPSAAPRELLVRLGAVGVLSPTNRAEFFRAAAHAIRTALLDRARLDGGQATPSHDPLALDGAFEALRARDPRLCDVATLRFHAGLSVEQAAAALELPAEAVRSDWHFARAWLLRRMRRAGDGPGPEQAA